jgi:hypothetical protein
MRPDAGTAPQMLLLLLKSYKKPKSYWNRVSAWRLSKNRTDLRLTLNEGDTPGLKYSKIGKTPPRYQAPTGDEDEV